MNLFEIDKSISECCDYETGEILDPEKLDSLLMERNKKIENVAKWVINLEADAEALKARKDHFAEREKATRNKIASLKEWLTSACNGEKFSTVDCVVSFRRSEKVEVVNLLEIPEQYRSTKYEIVPEKNEIKKAIRNGEVIPGVKLVSNLSCGVK